MGKEKLAIVQQLKPYAKDEEAYGRIYADLHDLIEASEWLLAELGRKRNNNLSADEIENFLTDLDVRYVKHVSFHLTSLRKSIKEMLAKLAEATSE